MKKDAFVTLSLFLTLVVFSASLVNNYVKLLEARAKIEKVKNEAEKSQKDNEELQRQAKLIESQEYIERELRNKLGLAREGEIVLVLPEADVLQKLVPDIANEEEVPPDPNWKRWLKLFL